MTRRTALLMAAAALHAQEPGGHTAYKDRPAAPARPPDTGQVAIDESAEADIAIGYFGPKDSNHPLGGTVWTGVSKAFDDANHSGGYRGKPFRLAPAWSENPWKGGVSQLARVVYTERVLGIITGIDGNTAHLAAQVATKALVPVLDVASTDKTVNGANVPWIFSCVPSDAAAAEVLAPAMRPYAEALTILAGTDHDSRMFSAELLACCARIQIKPLRVLEFSRSVPALPEGTRAIAVVAQPSESAEAVKELRRMAPSAALFCGPTAGRTAFLERSGAAAEGIRFPLVGSGSAALDYAGTAAYDAAAMLIEAIRRAGLNRAGVRDAIQALSPWKGLSGTIEWSPIGRNTRQAQVAKILDGRVALS